jgi:hypothetical protein
MKNEPNKSVSNISLRFRPKQGQSSTGKIVSEMEKYDDCPLLLSLITTDSTRAKRLTEDGYKQMTYPQSNDGWAKTLFVIEQRGLRNFWQPWCLSVLNATIWTVLSETRDVGGDEADVESWGFFIGVLNASLAFLLVFRLNRAAERYWVARATWGTIVSSGRHFIDSILVHGKHQPHYQDEAIRWTLAFSVAAMQYIRGDAFDSELFAGVLEPSEVDHMASMVHPPLYASSQIRAALKEIFEVTESTTGGRRNGSVATASVAGRHIEHIDGPAGHHGTDQRHPATHGLCNTLAYLSSIIFVDSAIRVAASVGVANNSRHGNHFICAARAGRSCSRSGSSI